MTASLHNAAALHLQQRHARHLRSCRLPARQVIGAEAGFDDLARLAAHLAHTPIAAIALANGASLALKSVMGLRGQSGATLLLACARAAKSTLPAVIADISKHPWFQRHHIGTKEEPLHFFAAIPLIDTNTKVSGTLVVMDAAPRPLSPEQLNAPQAVSRQIMVLHETGRRQSKLGELAAHQEKIKEQERKRIAQDMHDELGQNLMSLKLDLLRIQQTVSATAIETECGPPIQSAINHLDSTIGAVHHIINDLRPPVLELGLYAAIQWQLEKFRRFSQIHCELHANHHQWQGMLSDIQTDILFRVLRESLTNIGRHAQASRVLISLRRTQQRLEMCISDNGIGINSRDIAKQASFGLMGMRERLNQINGELHIASTDGQGTALTIDIPLKVRFGTALH